MRNSIGLAIGNILEADGVLPPISIDIDNFTGFGTLNVNFTEAINKSTVTSSSFIVSQNSVVLDGTLTFNVATVASFVPDDHFDITKDVSVELKSTISNADDSSFLAPTTITGVITTPTTIINPFFDDAFVADPLLGWDDQSSSPSTATIEATYFGRTNVAHIVCPSTGAGIIKQTFDAVAKETALENFGYDFLFPSTENPLAFDATNYRIYMDIVAKNLGGTSLNTVAGTNKGFINIRGNEPHAALDDSYLADLSLDQWFTFRLNMKQWLIDNLDTPYVWADVVTVDFRFISISNTCSVAIDNFGK